VERAVSIDPSVAQRVARLFSARSVAVVGASARSGSVGAVTLSQLRDGGFTGALYPVNPRYDELVSVRCYPSLPELPETPELSILAVPDGALADQLTLAAEVGSRAAVIFGGFSSVASEDEQPLADRLGAIAREHDVALCGPNGMGFIDFRRRLRAVGYYEPLGRPAGPVTLLSQSGSVFSALLHNGRGLGFDLAVSTGQEASLTVADYLLHVLQRETTEVVGLFLETLRDGPRFKQALEQALAQDVPIVALKVGRTSVAKELVRAHSGALAGDDGAIEALFDAYGVARVRTLDEMMDTLELLGTARRAGPGGLATVHDSGGERAHLADLVEDAGLSFARIGEDTQRRIAARLDHGLAATNPLDAWGSGNDFEAAYREHLLALHDDPDTAVVALAVDLTTEAGDDVGYIRVAREVQQATTKPFVILTNLTSGVDPADAARIRESGIPILEGTGSGLAAIAHLLRRRDAVSRGVRARRAAVDAAAVATWRGRLAAAADGDAALGETGALALLDAYGIPVVAHRSAQDVDAALAAAEGLGWPVALKTAAPGIEHKADVGGVHLGLTGPAALRAAYADLRGRLGPEVLVASMATGTAELALGVIRDPQIGSVLVIAAGGTLVEVLRDRQVALPTVDASGVAGLLARLAVWPLLQGARGAQPVDVDAVVDAVLRLADLAEDLGDHLAALDLNPLLVSTAGCVAVDALVIPARGTVRAGEASRPA
jgi:acetate---CoA ligase (ADP-forming)